MDKVKEAVKSVIVRMTKKVRGYLLSVVAPPESFAQLLVMAQLHNELEVLDLVKALCASAINNEYQHPAAERFVMHHAEFICSKRYSKPGEGKGDKPVPLTLAEVLQSKTLHFNDAASVVKDAKSKHAKDIGESVGSEEWQTSVDAGKCEFLFSLAQAQKCWDTQVLVFSGLGKKPKSVSAGEKAVWQDRSVLVAGFLAGGMDGEAIVALVGATWGSEATEALVEQVLASAEKKA